MHAHKPKNRLLLTFILNLCFTVFEFIGGLFTNSIALISDSIHDFGDSLTIGLSMFFEKKSRQKPDETYTYGYKRYSLLGGLFAAFSLVVGSTIIIIESVKRLINPEPIETKMLVYFALVGIIVNTVAAIYASKGRTRNEKIISLHLFEDVIGWVVLLIGAILMYFFNITILDSILSIGFTLYILFHVYKHLKEIVEVMMEKAPLEPTQDTIIKTLKSEPKVIDVHHLHHWSLEGEIALLTAHIVLADSITPKELVEVQKRLHDSLKTIGIMHATLEFEIGKDSCRGECDPENIK